MQLIFEYECFLTFCVSSSGIYILLLLRRTLQRLVRFYRTGVVNYNYNTATDFLYSKYLPFVLFKILSIIIPLSIATTTKRQAITTETIRSFLSNALA